MGDIVIWGTLVGEYGHIDICSGGADTNSFTGFDQNWPLQVDANGNGTGVCHFVKHNYNGVLGWLRPKVDIAPNPVQTEPMDESKAMLTYIVSNLKAYRGKDEIPSFIFSTNDDHQIRDLLGVNPDTIPQLPYEADPQLLTNRITDLQTQVDTLTKELAEAKDTQIPVPDNAVNTGVPVFSTPTTPKVGWLEKIIKYIFGY